MPSYPEFGLRQNFLGPSREHVTESQEPGLHSHQQFAMQPWKDHTTSPTCFLLSKMSCAMMDPFAPCPLCTPEGHWDCSDSQASPSKQNTGPADSHPSLSSNLLNLFPVSTLCPPQVHSPNSIICIYSLHLSLASIPLYLWSVLPCICLELPASIC